MASRRTKTFATGDVISVMTGKLVSERLVDCYYDVLSWMTGEALSTHQISRVSREALPVILKLHPHLAPVIDEAKKVTPDNWRDWLQTWEDRYGPEIAVPVMTIAEHERIDPESELAEKVPPHRIMKFGDI